jgi:hypothetical protein
VSSWAVRAAFPAAGLVRAAAVLPGLALDRSSDCEGARRVPSRAVLRSHLTRVRVRTAVVPFGRDVGPLESERLALA